MSFAEDRNLLYGVLALQMDFVSRDPMKDSKHRVWRERRSRGKDTERAGSARRRIRTRWRERALIRAQPAGHQTRHRRRSLAPDR